MKKLYAPWRNNYAKNIASKTKDIDASEHDCVFCQQIKSLDDEKNFILARHSLAIIMLNLYPYNGGHILVIPHYHCSTLEGLTQKARLEMIELITATSVILQNILKAQGINIGLNLGKAAGAGIPSHVHFHVLPRWPGDTNFLPVLADTKQISTDLHDVYTILRPHFQKLKINERKKNAKK